SALSRMRRAAPRTSARGETPERRSSCSVLEGCEARLELFEAFFQRREPILYCPWRLEGSLVIGGAAGWTWAHRVNLGVRQSAGTVPRQTSGLRRHDGSLSSLS